MGILWEVELFDQVFPVFVLVFRVVLFAAGVEGIYCSDTSDQGQVLSQKVLIHGDMEYVGAKDSQEVDA